MANGDGNKELKLMYKWDDEDVVHDTLVPGRDAMLAVIHRGDPDKPDTLMAYGSKTAYAALLAQVIERLEVGHLVGHVLGARRRSAAHAVGVAAGNIVAGALLAAGVQGSIPATLTAVMLALVVNYEGWRNG